MGQDGRWLLLLSRGLRAPQLQLQWKTGCLDLQSPSCESAMARLVTTAPSRALQLRQHSMPVLSLLVL
jgi:hypothetical protein